MKGLALALLLLSSAGASEDFREAVGETVVSRGVMTGTLVTVDARGRRRETLVPNGVAISRDGAAAAWHAISPGDRIVSIVAPRRGVVTGIAFRSAASEPEAKPARSGKKGRSPTAGPRGTVTLKNLRVKTVVGGGSSLILVGKDGKEIDAELVKTARVTRGSDKAAIEWWQIEEGDLAESVVIDPAKQSVVSIRMAAKAETPER